ncbi:MAG: hypothetical protein JSW73_04490 [Candidatus Woesearchaeota archaeon]|nr:MAG: hypothetical protein JSW73_04490 [Candidatus Woesearchaeota archaeon]
MVIFKKKLATEGENLKDLYFSIKNFLDREGERLGILRGKPFFRYDGAPTHKNSYSIYHYNNSSIIVIGGEVSDTLVSTEVKVVASDQKTLDNVITDLQKKFTKLEVSKEN